MKSGRERRMQPVVVNAFHIPPRLRGTVVILLCLGAKVVLGNGVLVLENFTVNPNPLGGVSYDQDGMIRAQTGGSTAVYQPSDLSSVTGYGNSSGVVDSGAGINDGVVTTWQLKISGSAGEIRQDNGGANSSADLSAYTPKALGQELDFGGTRYLMFIGGDGTARAFNLTTSEITALRPLPNPDSITGGDWYKRANAQTIQDTGLLVTYGFGDDSIGHFPVNETGARNNGEFLLIDTPFGSNQDITLNPDYSKLYLVHGGDSGIVSKWANFTPYEPIPPSAPASGVTRVEVLTFSNTSFVGRAWSEGTVEFTHAIQLSKDGPGPGSWETVGEIEQTNAVSSVVLNLSTNLPARVYFRLKWPP